LFQKGLKWNKFSQKFEAIRNALTLKGIVNGVKFISKFIAEALPLYYSGDIKDYKISNCPTNN